MATERLSNASSDHFRMAGSRWFVAPDDDTYYAILVPKFSFVERVYVFVSVAYVGGTPTLTVGFKGNSETANAAYFMNEEITCVGTAGLKCSIQNTASSGTAKYFNNGSGVITLTIAAGSATKEGTFRVFVKYALIF